MSSGTGSGVPGQATLPARSRTVSWRYTFGGIRSGTCQA